MFFEIVTISTYYNVWFKTLLREAVRTLQYQYHNNFYYNLTTIINTAQKWPFLAAFNDTIIDIVEFNLLACYKLNRFKALDTLYMKQRSDRLLFYSIIVCL